MSTRGTHAAARAATLLAALSVLMTVGAGVTAGVVMARDGGPDGSGTLVRGHGDSAGPDPTSQPTEWPDHDYTDWERVTGKPDDSGFAAAYQVPRRAWKTFEPDYAVAYRDDSGKKTASGHAPANYYGNQCSQDGSRVAGGWTVLADTEPSGDLVDLAEAAVRRWATGYASDGTGTAAPMSQPSTERLTLPNGSDAARSLITLDMSDSEGSCLPDSAEIMATTINTPEGAKTLVQARYLTRPGITDEEWQQISDSLEP
ncbi:hypothetical protein ncot_03685 [Nocardioides sp. JQ2195]|uniref:hypothetical protein n=1 Tax=Nocardioides sp. JQ2195 TaxID=2592334 RepID=UPI00143EB1F2|nr:hypothetical protein [Nocardioides sp. JQ2195]QIX25794.1 hypothetical protein ncot_03685 [Nocardioides sp. JQ2195]